MSIQLDTNTPIFTQKEVVRETGMKSKTIDNFLARLREIVPKLGGRPGKGERRLFSIADVRTFKIIERAAYFIGEQEAAKTAMAMYPRIDGTIDFEPEGCLVVEKRDGDGPPHPATWVSERFEFHRYSGGPPSHDRILDAVLLIPYGRLLKQADDQCLQIFNSRVDRSKPNPGNEADQSNEAE